MKEKIRLIDKLIIVGFLIAGIILIAVGLIFIGAPPGWVALIVGILCIIAAILYWRMARKKILTTPP